MTVAETRSFPQWESRLLEGIEFTLATYAESFDDWELEKVASEVGSCWATLERMRAFFEAEGLCCAQIGRLEAACTKLLDRVNAAWAKQPHLVLLPSALTVQMCSFLSVADQGSLMGTCHAVAKEEGELTEILEQELRAERDRLFAHLEAYALSDQQVQWLISIDEAIDAITLQNPLDLRRLVVLMRIFLGYLSAEDFVTLQNTELVHFKDALEAAKVIHAALQMEAGDDRKYRFLPIIKAPLAETPPDFQRAYEIAYAMPDEYLRCVALLGIVKALLQDPPDLESAITLNSEITHVGVRSSSRWDIIQVLLVQNPPAIDQALTLAEGIDAACETLKSCSLYEIVKVMLRHNPHEADRAVPIAEAIPIVYWNSKARGCIAKAKSKASSY